MEILKIGTPRTNIPRNTEIHYDNTNISKNPFDLIEQNVESIMNLLEGKNAAAENNV